MAKNYPAHTQRKAALSKEAAEAYAFAALADAPNTQRAYLADWKQFLTWCKNRNKSPLPVTPDDLATYLRFSAEKLKLKMSTVERRMAAISEAHKRNGFPSPTQEWVVRNTMKRLRRELGKPARGKKPILVEDLKKMIALCDNSIAGKRDKAVLLIGFVGAFRRSELAAIDIEDITTSDEGIVVMINGSKTDQKREGRKVAIPFGKNKESCPVTALLDWVEASNITEGPLFRGIMNVGRPRYNRMSDKTVADIVKKYSVLIGKPVKSFSGHSLRAGLATSAAMAGASEASIQKQTGHKSLLVLRRYIRDASLFRENVADKLGL